MNGLQAELGCRVGKRELLAGHRCDDAPRDLDEARAARIDDAGVAQDVEQLRRPRERGFSAREHGAQQLVHLGLRRREGLGLLGHLADDGEDRALYRLPNAPVRRVASRAQRVRHDARIDGLRLAEDLGGAADDLREDDPRVAPRAHERRARDGVRERRPRRISGVGQRLDERAHREGHVRARVAVGHGIDVEVVDARAARVERRRGSLDETPDLREIAHVDVRTSAISTSTDVVGIPVRRETS